MAGGVQLRKAKESPRVVMMGEAGLSCRLAALADFFTWVKDKNGESVAKAVHPPQWLVAAVAENGIYPGVRPLEGVAEVPFPRPDGSLVTEPGYDAATGVYYAPSLVIDPIPNRPTQADAADAARQILALVEQFPFATEDDQAVWLAALLTMIARPAIEGPTPGTAFNGNKAGTGKGKLIDAASTIAIGRPVPTTSYPRDEAEADKIKVAFALAATPIIHLDNLEGGQSYGGGVLDSALTSLTVSGRILGLSKTTEGLELRCCWFLSGNNISPSKDAFRRWLVCNLATELERPEERRDIKIPDLLAYIRAHRARYVRAALIILRAHAVAGRPVGDWAPLGSFEEWDRVVRGAVWFATGRDCNTTRRRAAEDSPERLAKLALLEAWSELPGGKVVGWGLTCEEAYRLAFGENPNLALQDVFARFSRDGKVSSRSIGFAIRGMKGEILNGMVFRTDREKKHSALWYVDILSPNCPDSLNRDPSETTQGGDEGDGFRYPARGADSIQDVNGYGGESASNQDWLEPYPLSPSSHTDNCPRREVGEL